MELKFLVLFNSLIAAKCSNRTFMELKCANEYEVITKFMF